MGLSFCKSTLVSQCKMEYRVPMAIKNKVIKSETANDKGLSFCKDDILFSQCKMGHTVHKVEIFK